MINWIYFPKSQAAPSIVCEVVKIFESNAAKIDSGEHELKSDQVLAVVAKELAHIGFDVETGKKAREKVKVPVLFGRNGSLEKSFEADAWHRDGKMVLEVEAGRGVTNNQFLKDLFQACMMHGVDYFGVAVRNTYRASKDFERVVTFFETLYASNRLDLPLQGVLVLGY